MPRSRPRTGKGAESAARPELHPVVAGLPTVAARIRFLAATGYARAEIARALGQSYQRVRNVLREPPAAGIRYPAPPASRSTAVTDSGAAAVPQAPVMDGDPPLLFLAVDEAGRVALPSKALDEIDAAPGDVVVAAVENGEILLLGTDATFRRVRQWRRRGRKRGMSETDHFLIERRREAALEEAKLRSWRR